MSSDSEDAGSENCPKCGTILEPYGDDGAECPNEECRWVQTSGFEGTTLDDSWSNGPWANDGETVAVGTEDDDLGKHMTVDWRDKIDSDPDDLNEKYKKILATVARNPDKKATEIAEMLELDQSATVYNAVKIHWQDNYESIKADENSRSKIPNEKIEQIRKRALSGETAAEIASELGRTADAVRKRIRGDVGDDSESDIPPLKYNQKKQRYEQATCDHCGEAFAPGNSITSHQWQCPENPDNIKTEETADDETSETESEETDTGTETTTDSQQYDELLQKAERIQRKQQEELEIVRRRFEASLYQRIKWWLFGADEDGDSA